MKHLILLIEGKRADRPSYMAGLSKKGYEVESVPNGASAIKVIQTINPRAIIIDAASMRTSGKRICSTLKEACENTPVLLVVAEDQEKIENTCADQILRLPFTLQKLLNRLRPYMNMNENKKLECGPIKLDMKERWVHCNGKQTRLTPRLFTLMETLMRHPGEVLQREELFKKIWETDYLGDLRSLDVHISWLRQAVEDDPRNPSYIQTERGIGYRLEVEKPKRPARQPKK
ncbi:MAG: response regulator transcription factor [Chloroflexi bacterium]|nr:response regulator transcription factor [Chloroflexota bacterium]